MIALMYEEANVTGKIGELELDENNSKIILNATLMIIIPLLTVIYSISNIAIVTYGLVNMESGKINELERTLENAIDKNNIDNTTMENITKIRNAIKSMRRKLTDYSQIVLTTASIRALQMILNTILIYLLDYVIAKKVDDPVKEALGLLGMPIFILGLSKVIDDNVKQMLSEIWVYEREKCLEYVSLAVDSINKFGSFLSTILDLISELSEYSIIMRTIREEPLNKKSMDEVNYAFKKVIGWIVSKVKHIKYASTTASISGSISTIIWTLYSTSDESNASNTIIPNPNPTKLGLTSIIAFLMILLDSIISVKIKSRKPIKSLPRIMLNAIKRLVKKESTGEKMSLIEAINKLLEKLDIKDKKAEDIENELRKYVDELKNGKDNPSISFKDGQKDNIITNSTIGGSNTKVANDAVRKFLSESVVAKAIRRNYKLLLAKNLLIVAIKVSSIFKDASGVEELNIANLAWTIVYILDEKVDASLSPMDIYNMYQKASDIARACIDLGALIGELFKKFFVVASRLHIPGAFISDCLFVY